jgi:hypothetical protein
MGIEFRFKVLVEWPRKPTSPRKRSPFKVTLPRSYALLTRELVHLRARSPVIIQTKMEERDIRNDGLPRADARRPSFPGVVITFEAPIGGKVVTLNFACDACQDWEDNVRAISLTLEHLRGADRYGVTKTGEQYRGWAALPPGAPLVTPPPMTVEQAAEFVANTVGAGPRGAANVVASPDTYATCYREAAKRWHPDRHGGTQHPQWAQLQQAASVLDAHHAGRGG